MAFTFRSMVLAKAAGSYSYRGSRADTPALFTRMSTRPKASLTWRMASATD